MLPDESPLPGSNRFPTTDWPTVAEMQTLAAPAREQRIMAFLVPYMKPVFCFLRARGYSLHQAEDLSQSFFLDLAISGDILRVDRNRGRFRTFLLTLLKRFASDQSPNRCPRQRAFDDRLTLFGAALSDEDRSYSPPSNLTPETVFEYSWACSLLARVQQEVKQQYVGQYQAEYYQLFEASQQVGLDGHTPTHPELGEPLGLDRDAVRFRLAQVKNSLRVCLRAALQAEGGSDAEVDDDIRKLFSLLGN